MDWTLAGVSEEAIGREKDKRAAGQALWRFGITVVLIKLLESKRHHP